MRRHAHAPLLLLASLVAACAKPPAETPLAQVTRMHMTAVGGHANVSAIHELEYDLHMTDAKIPEMDAVYRVTTDGRMRIDILDHGTRVYTEAYDGKVGWDMDGKGVATIDPAGAALWHGTQFPGQILELDDLASRGHKLAYVGREVVGGIDYHVLQITLSDGFVTYRYVNPATWLIERERDFRAFHPALDGKQSWIETVASDYRPVDGVMRAFVTTLTDLTTGKWQSTTTVTGFKANTHFDPAQFVTPAPPSPGATK